MNYIELTLYSVRVQKVLPIMRERSLISFSLNRTSTLPFGKIQSKNHCAKNINGERKTVKNTSVLQLAFVILIFQFGPNVKATYSICHRVRPVRCIIHCFHYTTKFNIKLMLKFIPWIKYNFLFHSQTNSDATPWWNNFLFLPRHIADVYWSRTFYTIRLYE